MQNGQFTRQRRDDHRYTLVPVNMWFDLVPVVCVSQVVGEVVTAVVSGHISRPAGIKAHQVALSSIARDRALGRCITQQPPNPPFKIFD